MLRRSSILLAPRTAHAARTRKGKLERIEPLESWNIVRGDTVIVTAGRDKGKTGTVLRVHRKVNRVVIDQVNLVKKHLKKTDQQEGGIRILPAPLHVSNVSLVDPVSGEPTRVARRYLEDGTKVRVAKSSGAVIPRPEILKQRRKPLSALAGPNDTAADVAAKATFSEEAERQEISSAIEAAVAELEQHNDAARAKRQTHAETLYNEAMRKVRNELTTLDPNIAARFGLAAEKTQ